VTAIDDAMKWGYNWELGPFEAWDALGFVETTDRMIKDGVKLPESIKDEGERRDGVLPRGRRRVRPPEGRVRRASKTRATRRSPDPAQGSAPVLKNDGAEAWDLGDGVLGSPSRRRRTASTRRHLDDRPGGRAAETDFRAPRRRERGRALLRRREPLPVVMAAGSQQWDQIRKMVKPLPGRGAAHEVLAGPVVVAPYGMTLGGGLELCFGGAAVQAAAETYSGLVEVGVGLIPGGAGNAQHALARARRRPRGRNVNTLES
jgi:3-hydroxyacyl-CoA dehydrogenase